MNQEFKNRSEEEFKRQIRERRGTPEMSPGGCGKRRLKADEMAQGASEKLLGGSRRGV